MKSEIFEDVSDINTSIKIGDKVKVYDGSSLSAIGHDEEVYIVYPYPAITGSKSKLQDMIGTVVEINRPYYCSACFNNKLYRCDLVIQLGEGKFRTNSTMVTVGRIVFD
jgi:hypothetical protein